MGHRPFNLAKNIEKGIKGGIIAGGGAAASLIASGQGLDDIEEKAIALVAAVIGYGIEALKNWLKNRNK